jgi:serine/threonine protein phosphatase PrpC
MQGSPENKGMGTTVAGLLFRQSGHLHFNVGDSRVYRFKAGFLRQLSIDDVRSPAADPAEGRRGSTVLTQCLGGAVAMSEIAPHVGTEPVVAGWRYLLCSDGLTDMVPLERIEAILNEHADDPDAVAALLAAALAGGGEDNISIIVATMSASA